MAGGLLFGLAIAQLLASSFSTLSAAQGIGVNYGRMGDNLPSPTDVINLYKSRNITKIRLFSPDEEALKALENSGIEVVLGTLNQDLVTLANSSSSAVDWVNNHILPHANSVKFRYINAGNEVIPGDLAASVVPAMQNLRSALQAANLQIPVTTTTATWVLRKSYPPSQGAFDYSIIDLMRQITAFLASTNTPLLVNVYPYVAYFGDPANVQLDYALFTANSTVVTDGSLNYTNLFDATVDALYSALAKAGAPDVGVVVAETGWPSGGGPDGATISNAETYNNNVVKHVLSAAGTPKKPGVAIETYMFAMFNEDSKPAGPEQHFGLFNPDMTEVYHVNFA